MAHREEIITTWAEPAEPCGSTAHVLDRVGEAIGTIPMLEPLLRRLLQILLDAVPAIDTAAILVRDGDRLVTRATIGLDESYVEAVGGGFAGTIAVTNRPCSAGEDDPSLDHPAMRVGGLKVRAAYGVPLADAAGVFGVAHVGSLTAGELARADRHLVATVLARAVPAIRQRVLREAEELASRELVMLQTVVDHTPQLVWIADADGKPMWLGRRWREHTGTRDVEAAFTDRRLLDAIAAGQAFHDTIPVRAADGSCRWYDTRALPVHDDGRLARWLVTHIDVTEQRYLDEATQLLASAPGYHDTLERIAQLVVPALAEGCIVDLVSDGAIHRAAIAHLDPEQLPAMQEWARQHSAVVDGERGAGLAIRTGEPDADLDGDPAYVVVPLVARGRALGAITLTSSSRRYSRADIAIARELGRRIGLAVDNARLVFEEQQVVQLRDDLLSIVSHELRAPLSAIDLGATHLIQLHGNEPRARKQLDAIRRSAERMDRLIGDLVDMAAIQGGRLGLERQPVDVAALLGEVLDVADVLAVDKGVTIARQIELPDVIVDADRDRLAQVLGNLVGHALDACRSGVIVRGFLADDDVQISIVDDGPGMPRPELDQLFEPGRRSDARQRAGLGLYIAKGIVETHGGALRVASTLGHGSTFVVTLRRRPA